MLELLPVAANPEIVNEEVENFDDASAVDVPPQVGANFSLDKTERLVPVFTTRIEPYVAEFGTVTDSDVAEALLTVAFAAPKYTVLLAAVVLNPVPVIVKEVPLAALLLEIELIVGWAIATEPSNKPVNKSESLLKFMRM